MKKILVIGGTSHIGYEIIKQIEYDLATTLNKVKDINYPDNVIVYLNSELSITNVIDNFRPNIIINCVGLNDVSLCEVEKDKANKINFSYVKLIVDHIKKRDIKLVQFSTSHVYASSKKFYSEIDYKRPENQYGLTKLKAEKYIKNSLSNYIIIRLTSVLKRSYPFQRFLLSDFIINKLKDKKTIFLVNDVYTNYISVNDVILSLKKLIENDSKGEFNVGGDVALSPYELGCSLKNIINTGVVYPISKKEFLKENSLAAPPKTLLLDNKKIKANTSLDFQGLLNFIS